MEDFDRFDNKFLCSRSMAKRLRYLKLRELLCNGAQVLCSRLIMDDDNDDVSAMSSKSLAIAAGRLCRSRVAVVVVSS